MNQREAFEAWYDSLYKGIAYTLKDDMELAWQAALASQQKSCSDNELDALNTLAKMFHNADGEVEGDDGLAMLVSMDLWNEGCEALETLIGEEEE